MEPTLRNKVIREAIELIIQSDDCGVCWALFQAYCMRYNNFITDSKMFEELDIPYFFSMVSYYWPIEDRQSRITFLKSQITC